VVVAVVVVVVVLSGIPADAADDVR